MRVPGFPPRSRQRGAVLLLAVLVLVIGSSFMLLQGLNASAGTLRAYRQQYDAEVLAKAKQALLGYAAASPEFASSPPPKKGPGHLPCHDDPTNDSDSDNPTLIDPAWEGVPVSNCGGTGVKLGRYPWRYLGTEQLRDASGERLWYAVSDNFRYTSGPPPPPVNSETAGTLCIDTNGDGTCVAGTDITDIVAVILAPGQAIGGQTRSAIPNQADYSNVESYLEGDNKTPENDLFLPRSAVDLNGDGQVDYLDLNDQVAYITRSELMAVVEKRVAGDARAALRTYYSASGATPADQFYPNAALLGKDSPHRVGWHGLRRGALPLDASDDGCTCNYVTATNSLSCTCSGTAKYEFTDAAVKFVDDTVPGICTATPNSCVCTGTGPPATDSCVVSGPPTLTVSREDEPVIFTASDGANCTFPPPAQPQDLPTICACTGDGSCYAQTSQHANTALSGPFLVSEWFDPNDWEELTYYTLSEECRAPPDGAGCAGVPQLQLGVQTSINALVATSGRTLNGTTCSGAARNQTRPSQDVCDYLDSDENTNVDDTYGQQLRSPTFNDQVTVLGTAP